MRILLSDEQHQSIPCVSEMMKFFITNSKQVYGKDFISYNVHSLEHICDDYSRYGNLNRISAFPFESFLGTHIKGAVRSGYKPLNQVAEHISSVNINFCSEPKEATISLKNKFISNEGKACFKCISFSFTSLKAEKFSQNDCYILLKNGQCGVIENIYKEEHIKLIIRKFLKASNFFILPLKSVDVGIYKVSGIGNKCIIKISDIKAKVMMLPYKKISV